MTIETSHRPGCLIAPLRIFAWVLKQIEHIQFELEVKRSLKNKCERGDAEFMIRNEIYERINKKYKH